MTKITVTANIMVGVLVLTERGTKFSLDISEGGDVIFFPMQIYRFPEVYGPQVSNLCLYYLLVSIYFVYFCHSTVFFFSHGNTFSCLLLEVHVPYIKKY